MYKTKFLNDLKSALSNELPAHVVKENMEYYSQYIDDERKKGRTEKEVVEELGDPWVIAKTIIDTTAGAGQDEYVYENSGQDNYRSNATKKNSGKGLPFPIVAILVILIVIFVLSMIFRMLMPLLPVIVVVAVVIYLKNKFTGDK